jgi:hypothetical protein
VTQGARSGRADRGDPERFGHRHEEPSAFTASSSAARRISIPRSRSTPSTIALVRLHERERGRGRSDEASAAEPPVG